MIVQIMNTPAHRKVRLRNYKIKSREEGRKIK